MRKAIFLFVYYTILTKVRSWMSGSTHAFCWNCLSQFSYFKNDVWFQISVFLEKSSAKRFLLFSNSHAWNHMQTGEALDMVETCQIRWLGVAWRCLVWMKLRFRLRVRFRFVLCFNFQLYKMPFHVNFPNTKLVL